MLGACGSGGGSTTSSDATTTTLVATDLTFTFQGLTPADATQTITCNDKPGFPIVANFIADGVDADTVCQRLADPRVVLRLELDVPPCGLYPMGTRISADVKGTIGGKAVETGFQRGNACGVKDWDAMRGVLPTIAAGS